MEILKRLLVWPVALLTAPIVWFEGWRYGPATPRPLPRTAPRADDPNTETWLADPRHP